MSGRALLALVIGIVLAVVGLALLVWLLWWLWTRGEREKEPPVVEFELEPQPEPELEESRQPERFSTAVEKVPPVPPPLVEPEAMPRALDEPGSVTLPMEEEPALVTRGDVIAPPPEDLVVEEPAARAPLPGTADDLKLIEGIGPKLASVLHEAGIETFAHLAATDVHRLEDILREADPRLLRLADPRTWPEQARLAAVGEWDALTELQRTLRGGRQAR